MVDGPALGANAAKIERSVFAFNMIPDFAMRSTLRRVVQSWMEPPAHRRGGVAINRAGLQVARVLYEATCHALRPRFSQRELATYQHQLDEDGLVVIPDFFSADDFEQVRDAFDQWGRSPLVRVIPDRNGTGVTWITGNVRPEDLGQAPFVRVLAEKIAAHPLIHALVTYVMRRRLAHLPTMMYQSLSVTEGRSDDTDQECLLHADRHFNTVKVCLLMNDNTERNGAFVFCKGSHRLSLARLRADYDMSVRHALVRTRRAHEIDPNLIAGRRILVAPAHADAMRLREFPVVGAPNTMIVSNNRGFHRRGQMTIGGCRQQIRLTFHGEEISWYGKVARWALAARQKRRHQLPVTGQSGIPVP